ncbi:MAG: ribonuclease III [Firmicutes bacterium]|nr:ribonuclease III [Bacillota bacterium]
MKKSPDTFDIAEISRLLGVQFKKSAILQTAFTHAAYANVYKTASNQRMEFLGDSVLGLIVSDYIYKHSALNEGELTRIKSQFVSEAALSKAIDALGVSKFLIVNKGSLGQGLHEKPSVKADLYESIVAAIYLDSGLEAARKFVLTTLHLADKKVKHYLQDSTDYKTQLQEKLQQKGNVKIVYKTTKKQGSAHEPQFVSKLMINGTEAATAAGSNKRTAEQEAARGYFKKL